MQLSGCLYYGQKRKNHTLPAFFSRLTLYVIFFFFISSLKTYCQQNNVGIGTANPDGSAILDLVSTTKGFLVPRMTTAQRDLISPAAAGLMIYNTTNSRFEYYNGTAWGPLVTTTLPTGAANQTMRYNGTTSAWEASSVLVNDGTNIGIGAAAPSQKLEVQGNILLSNTGTASELRLREPSAQGNNYTAFRATTQGADISYTLPASQGAVSTVLTNDGTGNLTWGTSIVKATVSVDPPYIDFGMVDVQVSIPNVTMGSTVVMTPAPGMPYTWAVLYSWVSADGTVTARVMSLNGSFNPAAQTFYVTVIK